MESCCFDRNLDRMSYLPDPIRSHIVSFLPTKDAMRTSILSKQWQNICSSLSQLEFDQSDFTVAADFKDFVDEMLIRHDGSDIKRFSLKTSLHDVSISSRRVSTWTSFALRHNVQDLELWIERGELEKLPFGFFTCNTIRVLSLLGVVIEWPSIIRFPVLKCLSIEHLYFYSENVIHKLLSSSTCPVLEDLQIRNCVLGVNTLSICNPSLKYIQIVCIMGININISASTLQKLDCIRCEPPPNITSETLSSLCNVSFDFYNINSICNAALITSRFNCVSKILMGLRNVETLDLNSNFIEFLSWGQALLPASLPSSYCSLKHLNLGLFPNSFHIQAMKVLLRSYPNLETLQISIDREEYDWHLETLAFMNIIDVEEDTWLFKELPAGDILNRLRMVEIREFEGRESEANIMRYLHENAKCLEKMNISCIKQQGASCQMKISEMLSSFARVAPNVTISLN